MKALIPHFIHQQVLAQQWQGSMTGFTMFVDLSGFTTLTDVLMARGSGGAETLSKLLNDIFGPLVKVVYARGGMIPHFAGDAFLAIFPGQSSGEDTLDAAAFAVEFFNRHHSTFGGFTIGLKIGLSYGEIKWGIAGQQHYAYYFRGVPVTRCALCQMQARNLEVPVVADETFLARLSLQKTDFREIGEGYYTLKLPNARDEKKIHKVHLPGLKKAIVQAFLPESLDLGQKEGEFRTIVSLFIAFEEIADRQLLHQFIAFAAAHIHSFSGYLKEIDFGDKGAVLVCFFGAPVSFEDNEERALECALSLQEKMKAFPSKTPLRIKTGATVGMAYAGFVGGQARCQYALVGTSVNLASRLMSAAQWGEILVDPVLRKSRQFQFEYRGNIRYKGMERTIPTYCLFRRADQDPQGVIGRFIGRSKQLSELLEFASPLQSNQTAGLVCIFGEAGIGKSRLSNEARQHLTSSGTIGWAYCPAEQILRKPLNAFLFFLKNYFDQHAEAGTSQNLARFENRIQNLAQKLQHRKETSLLQELQRTRSVLAALIGLFLPDTLWEQLDARGRYENAIQAIVNLFCCEAVLRPIVIHMEDAHRVDEHTSDLLAELLRQAGRFPILVLMTSRYSDDGAVPQLFPWLRNKSPELPYLEIHLSALEKTCVRELAEFRLHGEISNVLFDTLLRYSNANPFYIEQLLEYFEEQHLLVYENKVWTLRDPDVQLSSSIHAILTARIDRLSAPAKETVKAAAVIGREFELPVLEELLLAGDSDFPEKENARILLHQHIESVEKGQIWKPLGDLRYTFSHALLREAAYSMQVKARLRHLHRQIAEAIERLYAGQLEDRFFELAFHYEQAGMYSKTLEYLQKAGDYALSQYENQQALECFEKLCSLQDNNTHPEIFSATLLKIAKILERTGEWERCARTCREALALSEKSGNASSAAHAQNALGRLHMLQGDYFQAAHLFRKALQQFETLGQSQGLAEVLGHMGNLHFRQGNYEASEQFLLRCIEIARNLPNYRLDAQFVANLGLNYMNLGNYPAAITCQQEHLVYCQNNNDRQGMCVLLVHLGIVLLEKGDYADALEYFQQGLDLSNSLGNKQLTAVALGNIGEIYERQGNYAQAMDNYRKDLELCEALGDKQGVAIALGLIGQLLNIQGEFHRAIEYLQKDLMLCEDMGYLKGSAKALNTLGDIFFNLREYDRSLYFYDRAIALTRQIGQPLLLGLSLVEKGAVLLETGMFTEINALVSEAFRIAHTIGNPDLLFEAKILEVRVHIGQNHLETAIAISLNLLESTLTPDQQAAVYFELARTCPQEPDYAQKARETYAQLFAKTPRYLYKMRIEALSK